MINKFKALALLIVFITFSLTAQSQTEQLPHKSVMMLQIYSSYIENETHRYIPIFHEELRDATTQALENPQLLRDRQQGALNELKISYSKLDKLKLALNTFEEYYYGEYATLSGTQRFSPRLLEAIQENLIWLHDFIKILKKRKFVNHMLHPDQIIELEILRIRIETLIARTSLEIHNIWAANADEKVRKRLFGELKFKHLESRQASLDILNQLIPRLAYLKNLPAMCMNLFL